MSGRKPEKNIGNPQDGTGNSEAVAPLCHPFVSFSLIKMPNDQEIVKLNGNNAIDIHDQEPGKKNWPRSQDEVDDVLLSLTIPVNHMQKRTVCVKLPCDAP